LIPPGLAPPLDDARDDGFAPCTHSHLLVDDLEDVLPAGPQTAKDQDCWTPWEPIPFGTYDLAVQVSGYHARSLRAGLQAQRGRTELQQNL
jgi:hypothetical protein